MNMVICRHGRDSGKFLFQVPEEISIDAGQFVKVETKRGIQPAITITSSFKADPDVICPFWGTTPGNMKRVLSALYESALFYPEGKIPDNDIPFTDICNDLPE